MQTILIQEADDSIRDVLSLALEAEGFEVILTKNCDQQLLNLVNEIRPALLVLDFILDGSDSISLCQLIKASYPKLPVLAFSCNANIKDSYAGYGFDGYIPKPFDLDLLCSILRPYTTNFHTQPATH